VCGNEPLTYSIKNLENGTETQVEVNARFTDQDDSVMVEIGFDTNFGGRFDKTKGSFYVYTLSSTDDWSDFS